MAERKKQKYNHIRICEVCDVETKHIKKHIMLAHVPWYMSPAYACWDCQRTEMTRAQYTRFHSGHGGFTGETAMSVWFFLVNGFFIFVGKSIGLDTMDALLAYVVDNGLYSSHPSVSEDEFVFLREYDQRVGLEPFKSPQNYEVNCPDRISHCLHYAVLYRLVLSLDTACRKKLHYLQSYCLSDGSNPPSGHPRLGLFITDSHTHLDELFGRSDQSLVSLESLTDPPVKLRHVVANYVYPLKWGTMGRHMEMDPRVHVTIGVHPHMLFKGTYNGSFCKMEALLRDTPKMVGLGEVGLDFTTSCRCRQSHNRGACRRDKVWAQRQFLRMCLPLAEELGKPIVIHCRDSGNGTASDEVLLLFREMNLTHLPVQRHCFIGKAEEYVRWSTILPNSMFSLSARSLADSNTREALKQHGEPSRLLLETDAPYLAKNPTEILLVAKKAAELLKIPLGELVNICNENASRFFGLPY